jgi:hypothetical protein
LDNARLWSHFHESFCHEVAVKKLTQNQLTGQRGEFRVAERALAIGFNFDILNRLETGVDGLMELRDPRTGQTLAKWVGAQIKTTEAGTYVHEDDSSFEYLLKPDDLAYWRGSNIPVIIVLVRLSDGSMYWKPVDAGTAEEPRRLRFDKAADQFEKAAADRIAALCIDRDRLGSFVPPMRPGEVAHLTMVRVILPDEIFIASSLFSSGREAARELASIDPHAPYDWVIRERRFLSFRDPRGASLTEIGDEGSVEGIETDSVAFPDDLDDEHLFIELLGRTLSVQLEHELSYDRESRALYFRAPGQNKGRKYRYRSLVKETCADVVSVWRKGEHIGSVRHHAFVPRFQRIDDEWFLSITPTFIFTRDGYRSHYNSGALIAGKKRMEKEGAVRGQFVMWRHLLIRSGERSYDLLSKGSERPSSLQFEAIGPVTMPLAVPEDAWRQHDPNAANMVDEEWLV